jgi:signal transduction histidine kinase
MTVRPDHLNILARGLAYLAAYAGLDYVSYVEPYRGLAITPWNPGAGLTLAVMLLGGPAYAPFVLLAPTLAGALVRSGSASVQLYLAEGLLIGSGYVVLGLIVRSRRLLDPRMASVSSALALVLIAVVGAAMASAAYVGAFGAAGLLESREIVEAFTRFFIGDLIGILVVTPLLLLIARRRHWPQWSWEALLPAVAITVALIVIFGLPHAREYQLFYLLFLPLLWCALRWGVFGAATALAGVQVGIVAALTLRHGEVVNLVSFQMLMISLSATGLVLGSLVGQQQSAAARIHQQQLALNRALRVRSMGEIATTIAHELNQPITSIKAFGGVANDAVDEGNWARAREAIVRLRSECDRVSSTIRATRELLSKEAYRPQLVRTEQVVGEVRELISDRLAPNDIDLAVEIDSEATLLKADPAQMKQALYNILDNSIDAIAASDAAGSISLAVYPCSTEWVEIAVRDSGPGFPSGFLEHGVGALMTTKPDGTGIGLAIARSVAEAHGGSLKIEHDLSGTVVKVRLPVALEEAS